MEYRRFGTTDFHVSRIGLGCMSMSGAYGPADDAESIATLHRAFDLGVNLLDTSGSYGNGHNHQLLARALKGRRERIIIHSKSGSPRTPEAGGGLSGGSPEYLTGCAKRASGGWRSTYSTSTACRASTPTSRSRSRWAPWRAWWSRARSATSACRRRARAPFGGPNGCTPSSRCRWSTPSGPGM